VRRRRVFAFGLVCAVVAELPAVSPSVASAAPPAHVNGDSSDLVSWNGSTWSQPKAVKLTGGPWAAMAETSCPTSTF
jgi:hypothetical protein